MTGPADSSPIRVVVCDDVPEMRGLLRDTLEDDPIFQVVGEAENGRSGVAVVADLQPDVVILDLSMPEMDGLEAIPHIAESSPRTGIVVLSGFEAARMREQALKLGADEYIEKGTRLEALSAAVQNAARARRG